MPLSAEARIGWILVERLFIAARCCGAAERLLDEATAWAQEREAFGGPIIENQGVSFPLADSLTELHAARLMTYHAAHAVDTLSDRKVVHGKVAMAKLYASEMAGGVAQEQFDELNTHVDPTGNPPKGLLLHASGAIVAGSRWPLQVWLRGFRQEPAYVSANRFGRRSV